MSLKWSPPVRRGPKKTILSCHRGNGTAFCERRDRESDVNGLLEGEESESRIEEATDGDSEDVESQSESVASSEAQSSETSDAEQEQSEDALENEAQPQ